MAKITIDDLAMMIQKQFESIEGRFEGIEQRFNGVEQRFNGIEQRFDGVEQRFNGIEQDIGEMKGRLKSLEKGQEHVLSVLENGAYDFAIKSHEKRISRIETKIGLKSV